MLSYVRLFVTPMDCSLLGSSVHGILQAKILQWVALLYMYMFVCVCVRFYLFINLCWVLVGPCGILVP